MIRTPPLLLVLSMIATGCKRPEAVTSTMTIREKKDLTAALAELESALEEHSPFLLGELAPPASEKQLADLQAALNGKKVQALEIWYQWHNGSTDRNARLLPLGYMQSISEALSYRQMMQELPFVDAKRRAAIKILDDGSGDGFFLDVTRAPPRVFYDMLEDPYPMDYGTLSEFVQFITAIHAEGLARQKADETIVFDFSGTEQLEAGYRKKLSQQRQP